MAKFLWTFAVTEVLKKMVKLTATQLGIALGLKKELPKLKDSLLMVQAILRDVDKIKIQHESVKLWVDKLEDLVFEADVLLNDLAYKDLRQKVEAGKHKIMVRNFDSYSTNSLVFGAKMAHKIKGITERLHQHYCVASSIGLVAISSMKNEVDVTQIQAETDSFVDEFGVIGRENEVSETVNKLIEFSSGKMNLSVLPIVGMGGLGKTAVAKVIFNHESIKRNFDRTIWVCVFEYFIIKNVLRAVLETLNANVGGLDRKEVILQELHKLLNDQKYLLVLDGVWNEDCLLWSELRTCLLRTTHGISMIGHPSWPDDLPIDTAGRKIRTTHGSENFVTKLHMLTFDGLVFKYTASSFIFLRVLIACSWFICFVPHSITKLKHSRYLDVSQSSIKELPDTVALLYNLQTLKLESFMVHLPKDMKILVSLRHLEFSFDLCDQTKQMPRHLGRLTTSNVV